MTVNKQIISKIKAADELDCFRANARQTLIEAGIRPDLLKSTVDGLVFYYTEPTRYYHDVRHINALYARAEEAGWDNYIALKVAILFHDVYYKVGAVFGYNERLSAMIADDVLQNCVIKYDNMPYLITTAIRNTANFMANCNNLDVVSQRMCDVDLASLAKEPYEDFVAQQYDVLKEHKSDDLAKSANFLSELIKARGNGLYYTEYAYTHWFHKAKENIERFCKEYKSEL